MAGALRLNGSIICFGCWRTPSFEGRNGLSSTQIYIRVSDGSNRKISVALMHHGAYITSGEERSALYPLFEGGNIMKVWSKPAVREQEVGLEVTSYLPAEIDII